jgi:flavin reductase (DIM6/NTAB) family NADH-FMN oxidoreductase RutF
MVFGEVVHVAIRRAVLADDGLPDPRLVDPLARLGRAQWSLLGQVDSVERIRWQEWQDGRRTER